MKWNRLACMKGGYCVIISHAYIDILLLLRRQRCYYVCSRTHFKNIYGNFILFSFFFFFDGLNKTRQELERFIDTKEIYMYMYTEEGIRV